MKTNIVLEGLRRRWMDSIVWRVSAGARSTKILLWRVQEVLDRREHCSVGLQDTFGLTKLVFWRALEGAGSTKIMSWRAPGGGGSTKSFFGKLQEAFD